MLDAAQDLFLSVGYERASVDAIAERAAVSKRTAYDHFGDKESIYSSVVERVGAELMTALQVAVEEELPDGCALPSSLLAFARRVATGTFASSEYVLFRKLLAAAGTASLRVNRTGQDPQELVVERMTAFALAGEIEAPNPRRAAEHFVALTFLLALDALDVLDGAQDETASTLDEILSDGVDAFLRAYGPVAALR